MTAAKLPATPASDVDAFDASPRVVLLVDVVDALLLSLLLVGAVVLFVSLLGAANAVENFLPFFYLSDEMTVR
jgi:hypothetical protein